MRLFCSVTVLSKQGAWVPMFERGPYNTSPWRAYRCAQAAEASSSHVATPPRLHRTHGRVRGAASRQPPPHSPLHEHHHVARALVRQPHAPRSHLPTVAIFHPPPSGVRDWSSFDSRRAWVLIQVRASRAVAPLTSSNRPYYIIYKVLRRTAAWVKRVLARWRWVRAHR